MAGGKGVHPPPVLPVRVAASSSTNAASFSLVTALTRMVLCMTDRFKFHKRSQLFIRMHNKNGFRRRDARQQCRLFARESMAGT